MMEKQKLLPDRAKILSGSALKVIAVVTMLIDHVGSHLTSRSYVLLTVAGNSIRLYPIMRIIGRIAFPLFAFLLVEGFVHTRNRVRYGLSLFICALISEIPWNLVHGGKLLYGGQNVFFTLTVGFLGLCVIEYFKGRPILQAATLIGLAVFVTLLRCDYSIHGYAFIILLYALRNHEILRIFSSFALQNHWYVLMAFLPISLYNGKRGFIKGSVLKYAFYLFYPAHLLIIYLIKYKVLF